MSYNNDENKKLRLLLSDVLLCAELYHAEYPFDDDHKAKHQKLFEYVHEVLHSTMTDVKLQVGIEITQLEKETMRDREVLDAAKELITVCDKCEARDSDFTSDCNKDLPGCFDKPDNTCSAFIELYEKLFRSCKENKP